MSATPGQVALRKFDHQAAIDRYAAGQSAASIARDLGVSKSGVLRVVNPRIHRKMNLYTARLQEAMREPCRGGCGILVWTHTAGASGYCRACYQTTFHRRERHGTPTEYGKWGCRCEACTAAATAARRDLRHRRRAQK